MIINHNIAALNTHRQLGSNNAQASKNLEKLSSGLKINRAGDDAAGLAISEKMRGQIRGLDMAQKNAQDSISLIQTAEGALNETHDILQRMRELAVQSSNDTNTDADRSELQKEVTQLANALNDISSNTQFNTKELLDGNFKGTFHVGANQGQNLEVAIGDMSGTTLAVATDYTVVAAGGTPGAGEVAFKEAAPATGGFEANQTITIATGDLAAGADLTSFEYLDASGKTQTATHTTTGGTDGATAGYFNGTELIQAGAIVTGIAVTGGATVTLTAAGAEATEATEAGYYNSADKLVVASETDSLTGSVTAGIDISDQKTANTAITTIQTAIDKVSAERSKLGAVQNRLDHTINNLGTSSENLTAAESRIRDVDMAKEMMDFTKNNILTQAAQAMLAQAQQSSQGVLQLLR